MNPKHNQEWLAGDDRDDCMEPFPRSEYIECLIRGGVSPERAELEADELYRSME